VLLSSYVINVHLYKIAVNLAGERFTHQSRSSLPISSQGQASSATAIVHQGISQVTSD